MDFRNKGIDMLLRVMAEKTEGVSEKNVSGYGGKESKDDRLLDAYSHQSMNLRLKRSTIFTGIS